MLHQILSLICEFRWNSTHWTHSKSVSLNVLKHELKSVLKYPRETPLKTVRQQMIQQDTSKDISWPGYYDWTLGIIGLNIAGLRYFLEQVPRNLDKNRRFSGRKVIRKQTNLTQNSYIDDFGPTSRWKLESWLCWLILQITAEDIIPLDDYAVSVDTLVRLPEACPSVVSFARPYVWTGNFTHAANRRDLAISICPNVWINWMRLVSMLAVGKKRYL